MNREVHVRIWERPEVRVLRATRRSQLAMILACQGLATAGTDAEAALEGSEPVGGGRAIACTKRSPFWGRRSISLGLTGRELFS